MSATTTRRDPAVLLDALRGALERRGKIGRVRPDSFTASCPCHDDSTPSLSVGTGDAAIVLRCFGCDASAADVLDALSIPDPYQVARRLTVAGLFYDSRGRDDDPARLARELTTRSSGTPTSTKGPSPTVVSTTRPLTMALPVADEHRQRLRENVGVLERLDAERCIRADLAVRAHLGLAPDGRIILPTYDRDGEPAPRYWCAFAEQRNGARPKMEGPRGASPDLFPRPESPRLDDEARVLLVEGEADALVALSNDIPAIGCPGTNAWKPTDAERFGRFAGVTVIGDADPAGRAWAGRVAADLQRVGVDVTVRDYGEDRPKGYDLTDLALEARTHHVDLVDMIERLPEVAVSAPPIDESEWPDPIPIEAARTLPEFPVDLVPAWLGEWIGAEAEATQTPLDLAGVMSLAAVATCVQRAVDIELGGWVEPLCVWALVVMESGSRKTQVQRDVFAPIITAETELRDEFGPAERERAGDEVAHAEALKRLRAAEAKAIESGDASAIGAVRERRVAAEKALHDLEVQRRPAPRLIAEDVTPERYLRLMQEQGGALTLSSDEGGVFATFGGRYRQGNDAYLEPLLKAHAGSTIRVDRQSSEPIIIDRPRGTIAVTLQEDALRRIGSIPDAQGLGLIARCVAVFPPDMIGTRHAHARRMPPSVSTEYADRLRALASVGYRAEGHYVLRLDESAQRRFDEFRDVDRHEGRLRRDLAPIKSWGSKMPGLVGRIAGLLHLVEHGADGLRIAVSEQTVERSIRLAEDYLIPHAFVLHEIAAESPDRRAARDILAWILRDDVVRFTSRDATRAVRWLETRTGVRDAGLGLLVDPHGVIREGPGKSGTRGVEWHVNPKARERLRTPDKADKPADPATQLSGLSGLSGVPNSASESQ